MFRTSLWLILNVVTVLMFYCQFYVHISGNSERYGWDMITERITSDITQTVVLNHYLHFGDVLSELKRYYFSVNINK